ncbi:MAG TPA: tetratricopeptide repeat protein [Sandaracinaceae bacterium LLY-WYZ-13_1]|nr:tetratricopeptide repeat protein [Sandaracinaceae bacterium LLY-WYZ-13_1]
MRSQREHDLGVGLFQEGNLAGAFEHLFEATELDPYNAEAHLMLGKLFMIHRHDYERAEQHFQEALRAHEEVESRAGLPADTRNSLGVLYIHWGRLEDAVEVLRASASDLMNRDPAVAWSNLGWAYLEMENHQEALRVLRQAVQLQPQLCLGWYRIGQVQSELGETEEADRALSRALDVDDDTCQRLQVAWRLRGEIRARMGHREEAIADLERCVELSAETEDGQACQRMLEASP